MYDVNQKNLFRVYACFCLILLCIALFVCCSGPNTGGLENSTDREIGAIKEQQRQAGAEISRAGADVSAAEDALDRAGGAVSESRERAAALQAGVAECQKLARECQDLAARNSELIDGLGK